MADNVTKAVGRHRALLLEEQRRANVRMAEAYARAWQSIARDHARLQTQIRLARLNGDEVHQDWLRKSLDYAALIRNIERELTNLAPIVAGQVDTLTQAAVDQALADARTLTATVGIDDAAFTHLNTRAVAQIVGATNRGPLSELIAAQAGPGADRARRVLEEAVLRGWSPHKTARALEAATTTLGRSQALRLARTEQMRAYREATRLSYVNNPAVSRWRWSSRLIPGRTCSYCWAMHGTTHSVRRVMPTHPNCMCVMVPEVADVDYGPVGPDRFAALSPDEQRTILGPAGFLAYQAGDLKLSDLVVQGRHPKWGAVGRAGSLAHALGAKKAAAYITAARP